MRIALRQPKNIVTTFFIRQKYDTLLYSPKHTVFAIKVVWDTLQYLQMYKD